MLTDTDTVITMVIVTDIIMVTELDMLEGVMMPIMYIEIGADRTLDDWTEEEV